jgi:peroxiredoxin
VDEERSILNPFPCPIFKGLLEIRRAILARIIVTVEEPVKLSEFRGKHVVLYFYPKDMTPGCTTESCDFRDRSGDFNALNTIILGISPDSIKRLYTGSGRCVLAVHKNINIGIKSLLRNTICLFCC